MVEYYLFDHFFAVPVLLFGPPFDHWLGVGPLRSFQARLLIVHGRSTWGSFDDLTLDPLTHLVVMAIGLSLISNHSIFKFSKGVLEERTDFFGCLASLFQYFLKLTLLFLFLFWVLLLGDRLILLSQWRPSVCHLLAWVLPCLTGSVVLSSIGWPSVAPNILL